MDKGVAEPVQCRTCRHYYITWNKKFPHGCRAAGFQSAMLPCLDVFAASARPCLLYEEKKVRGPGTR